MTGYQYPLTVWNFPVSSEDDRNEPFSLPGLDELLAYADLWEEGAAQKDELSEEPSPSAVNLEETAAPQSASTADALDDHPEDEGASLQNSGSLKLDVTDETDSIPSKGDAPETQPFPTPASIPESAGPLTLTLTLQRPDIPEPRYLLHIPPLLGKGSLSLGETVLTTFNSFPGAEPGERLSREKVLEITDLMDRASPLSLTFEPPRPAAVCGIFSLHAARRAVLTLRHALRMDSEALMTFEIDSSRPGRYVLTLDFPCLADIPQTQIPLTVGAETALVPLQIPLPRHPSFLRCVLTEANSGNIPGEICDTALYPLARMQRAPKAALPIPDEDTTVFANEFAESIEHIGIHAVYTQSPLSSACLSALQEYGILACYPQGLIENLPPALCLHPAVVFMPELSQMHSGAASAWQFCGLLSQPRPLPQGISAVSLLKELFGTPQEPDTPSLPAFLSFLHLLYVRLHAESVRQGTGSGALCAAAEWDDPDIQKCLAQVHAPCHLSISPLRGAWYAGSTFIATVVLFTQTEDIRPFEISIALTDASGQIRLLRKMSGTRKDLVPFSLQETLPEQAGILTLTGELSSGGILLESISIPVFVGKRGLLEAALTLPGLPEQTCALNDSQN